MNYQLLPTEFFLSQLNSLSFKTRQIIKEKLLLAKENPFRYKRIKGYNLFLFRIRAQDNKKAIRIIYLLDKNLIKILCILDRSKNYKDLKKYLNKLSY